MHPLLKSLADSPELFEAARSLVLSKFTTDLTIGYDKESNEHIGQLIRARIDGRKLVEEAFRDIAKLKTIENKEEINQAR